MNKIKKDILENFEKVEFISGEDFKLIGYAEMFGNDCIPLYEGINYVACSSPVETVYKMTLINEKARTADGFKNV